MFIFCFHDCSALRLAKAGYPHANRTHFPAHLCSVWSEVGMSSSRHKSMHMVQQAARQWRGKKLRNRGFGLHTANQDMIEPTRPQHVSMKLSVLEAEKRTYVSKTAGGVRSVAISIAAHFGLVKASKCSLAPPIVWECQPSMFSRFWQNRRNLLWATSAGILYWWLWQTSGETFVLVNAHCCLVHDHATLSAGTNYRGLNVFPDNT